MDIQQKIRNLQSLEAEHRKKGDGCYKAFKLFEQAQVEYEKADQIRAEWQALKTQQFKVAGND